MKPASKIADMYNYRVAAYLKTRSEDLPFQGLSLKSLDFNVIPKSIPKENSLLNVEILFDMVISSSEFEYLCECKHHQEPHPLTVHSTEFKDGILEFIAAEKYRMGHIKRDGIFYLLITNCPILTLRKEFDQLTIASDEELIRYSEELRKRAKDKWTSFNPEIEIKVEWIRNALKRMVLLEIDDGRLNEASMGSAYEQELRRMMEQMSKANPALVPIEYRVKNTIRLFIRVEGEELVGVPIGGYFIEISRTILDQILSFKRILNEHFVLASPEDIPFTKSCEVLHHPSISPEDSMALIIEVSNDIIRQHFGKTAPIVVINPGTFDVYFAELGWLYGIINSEDCINGKGLYDIAKIAEKLPIKVSDFVIENLIKEAMRLQASIIIRKDRMEFPEVEDPLLQPTLRNTSLEDDDVYSVS